MAIRESGTAIIEAALYTGWFSERFAREKQLSGPQHYLAEMLSPEVNLEAQQAIADAELMRMAAAGGRELEDIPEDE